MATTDFLRDSPVANDWSSASSDELAVEIERLNRELCEATDDRIKAAQYGLILLQEKERVQEENERIESLYEAAKQNAEAKEEVCSVWSVSSVQRGLRIVFGQCGEGTSWADRY
jgi:hypothetical protein